MNQFPATVDFPSLPVPLAEKYPAENLRFRAFGTEKEDLAVDFSETDLPFLVSRILSQCAAVNRTDDLPEQFFWDLSVGKRLECLLRLAAAEKEVFAFPFGCGSCGEQLEIELTLKEITEIQNEADRKETIAVKRKGEKFVFRKPLGRDQKDWQNQTFDDERAAMRRILGSLQISGAREPDLSDDALRFLEEAFDEADPLVNFNCRADCFECGAANRFEIDLLAFALGELRRLQWSLLYTVHRLASHYHWNESEIFAVPHWRRQQYLSLITERKAK